MIHRLARLDVRRDARETHRVRGIGRLVEDVELPGQTPEREVAIEVIPCSEKAFEPHVPRVLAESHVIAERAPHLAGLVIAAERRTRRDAHHMRGEDSLFKPCIEHTLSVEAAEAAAFEHHARRVRGRRERLMLIGGFHV